MRWQKEAPYECSLIDPSGACQRARAARERRQGKGRERAGKGKAQPGPREDSHSHLKCPARPACCLLLLPHLLLVPLPSPSQDGDVNMHK